MICPHASRLLCSDATSLDIWVLDQVRSLLHNASSNPDLDAKLRADKTVFFLHLLGLDTTGHSYRPHSKVCIHLIGYENRMFTCLYQEYMNNIQIVDAIVRQTEELFTEFYKDEKTSYIFTADHGMSKIGNHGDGGEPSTISCSGNLSYPRFPCVRPRQHTYSTHNMGCRTSRAVV